jgi:RNA polymerase sigma-54 factor
MLMIWPRQNIITEEESNWCCQIQQFDPPGICARNLQECLLLQLERKLDEGKHVEMAMKVLEKYFEEFTKKHYEKIQRGLGLNDEQLKAVINQIIKLNPKPAGSVGDTNKGENYVVPDFFIVTITENGTIVEQQNAPDLRIGEDTGICKIMTAVVKR